MTTSEVTSPQSPDLSEAGDLQAATGGLSTAPAEDDSVKGLGPAGWARWTWRQLTSMRTALILLFLLALGSIPGSVFPQRGTNNLEVTQYFRDHPGWAPVLDRLGMFEVFGAPWFSAIYVLLFVSLIGCVIPRTLTHARVLRQPPPKAPRYLTRLPCSRSVSSTELDPVQVLDQAARTLRRRRWRVRSEPFDGATGWVGAEKGYSREAGNLLFHVSLLVILAAVALGSLTGFSGRVIVKEGTGFADALPSYDSFTPGRLTSADNLPPFSFTLDHFSAAYQDGGQQSGAPRQFSATVTSRQDPDSPAVTRTMSVNDPLVLDGVKVFLVGHGYAPTFTIRDRTGAIVFQDSVVFLPQDADFTSTGVVKAFDTTPELGLQGFFLPTAAVDQVRGPYSSFPAANNPAVFLSAWTGTIDASGPQTVYKLDTSGMRQVGIKSLTPGQTWKIPGTGQTVRFDGFVQYATFSIAQDPGTGLALAGALLAILGLSLSLLVQRRRVWVRASRDAAGATVVEVAGLTRSEHASVADEVDALVAALPVPSEPQPGAGREGQGGRQ
jgi:cytochrome c biogenesis protein